MRMGWQKTTLTLGTNPGATLVEASVEGISEKVTFVATTRSLTSENVNGDDNIDEVDYNAEGHNPVLIVVNQPVS